MNTEIIETENGKFALIINGELYAEYTRKSSAQRRLNNLLQAKESQELQEQEASTAPAVAETAQAGLASGGAVLAPPTSNTGGLIKVQETGVSVSSSPISEVKNEYLMINGKLKQVPVRCGIGTSAHIDTLTITMRQDVFIDHDALIDEQHPENITLLARKISETMHTIFGFGISEQKNGINGYKYSFRMASENANYGLIAFGGKNQKDSIMIYLFGEGLTAAKDGWENAFYNWLQVWAPYAVITRCDLAHDFPNGEYTPDMAKQDWINGGFTQAYTRPRAREHGYDWLDERHPLNQPEVNGEEMAQKAFNRTGKTFYVGTPNSSRMVRVYEKGCELGDNTSSWVRFELQIRNRDYIIPHEILIEPGKYLTGSYPICQQMFIKFHENMKKTDRVKKTEMINLEHVVKYASQAASPCINLLEQLGFDAEEITTLLKGGKFKLPKRLGAEKYDVRQANQIYIHEMKFIAHETNSVVAQYLYQLHLKEERLKREKYFEAQYREAEKMRLNNQIFGNYYDYF